MPRSLRSVLCAAAALMPLHLTACATPPATPSGTSWVVPHFTFEPMCAEKQTELRHAIANCAKVEMAILWFPNKLYRTCSDKHWHFVERTQHSAQYSWKQREWVREFKQGAELDAILNKLSAVQQWYIPVFDKSCHVTPGAMLFIRLLDTEGKVLLCEERAYGPWISCMGEQGERVSLSDFFPEFPDRKSFGK